VTNTPKMIAIVLLVLGLAWVLVWTVYLTAAHAAGKIDLPATALGLGVIMGLPAIGLFVGSAVLFRIGGQVGHEISDIEEEKSILEALNARGEVFLPQLAAELHSTPDKVRNAVYRLAGKDLFTGYANWQEQKLYSKEASKMTEGGVCPNCGGKLELAGKGTIRCPYCGTDIFMPTS
jgi:DNA-directed RNA polymerase subunit RPC12/RpoP